MMDLRDIFFDELLNKAKLNKDIILLTADMGAHKLNEFKKELPNQFFNVGIAEQNMISVAAGLALNGKKVYCYAISSFLILRTLEQIKIDVCNMNTNVVLVGIGAGVDYSYDGSTHHCPNDIGILRTLPNMKIFMPFDEDTVRDSVNKNGPLYIRLLKGNNVPDLKVSRKGTHILKYGKKYIVTYGSLVNKILNFLNNYHESEFGLIAITEPDAIKHVACDIFVEPHYEQCGLRFMLGEHAKNARYIGFTNKFIDYGGSVDFIETAAGIDFNLLKKYMKEIENE